MSMVWIGYYITFFYIFGLKKNPLSGPYYRDMACKVLVESLRLHVDRNVSCTSIQFLQSLSRNIDSSKLLGQKNKTIINSFNRAYILL